MLTVIIKKKTKNDQKRIEKTWICKSWRCIDGKNGHTHTNKILWQKKIWLVKLRSSQTPVHRSNLFKIQTDLSSQKQNKNAQYMLIPWGILSSTVKQEKVLRSEQKDVRYLQTKWLSTKKRKLILKATGNLMISVLLADMSSIQKNSNVFPWNTNIKYVISKDTIYNSNQSALE